MFCKHCGTQISDDAVFCDKCGQNVQSSNTNVSPKPKKKAVIASAIAVVLIVAVIAVLKISGGFKPIVGKWNFAGMIPVSIYGDFPTPFNSYIDIKRNGTFALRINNDLHWSGTWEPYTGSSYTGLFSSADPDLADMLADTYMTEWSPYVLEFGESSEQVVLFYKKKDGSTFIHVIMDGYIIMFSN